MCHILLCVRFLPILSCENVCVATVFSINILYMHACLIDLIGDQTVGIAVNLKVVDAQLDLSGGQVCLEINLWLAHTFDR